jgi:predicted nucleotidyltransferase
MQRQRNLKDRQASPALDEILNTLRARLPELRERYGVASLGVFGSYVRGEQRPRSDLDILVEFERAPTLFRLVDLQDEIRGLAGVKVDLVIKRTLKPAIGRHILSEVVYV